MSTPKKRLGYRPSPWTQRSRPRDDSLGEMDVNARDQLGVDQPGQSGEMGHRSDRARSGQLLNDLTPDRDLEELNKKSEAQGASLRYATTGRFKGARADAYESPNDIDDYDVEQPTDLEQAKREAQHERESRGRALGDWRRLQSPFKKQE